MNKIVVETANLTKMYLTGGAQFYALRNVNLKVSAGEFISIVGPSGSGKSTLLNMLGALDRPTSGHVYIGGVDMFQLDSDQLAEVRNRMLGFIFQSHNLITRTSVMRNVEMPLIVRGVPGGVRRKMAAKLLQMVGLGTKVHRRAADLSGGEQQRVAVARALINQPRIVLGDEPTGNLDSKTGAEVVELMRQVRSNLGTTFVLVTHNPEVANATDRIIYLRDGEIRHEEFIPHI